MRLLGGARGVGAALLVAFLGLVAGAPGCSRDDDGTAPQAAGELPPLAIRDDTPNLLLTWIDDKGGTHVELHAPDVPAAGRSLVRVVVSDREDGTRDLFYVCDLSQRQADGSYAARTMPRREWEAVLEARRREFLAKNAPPPPIAAPVPPPPRDGKPPRDNPKPPPPIPGVVVIIYGAAWCKPCHQASDYLHSIGVPHVMKDVEKDEGAASEMSDKLQRAGRRGGGIPVIDVSGQILVGYNKSDIDRALKRASSGTVL